LALRSKRFFLTNRNLKTFDDVAREGATNNWRRMMRFAALIAVVPLLATAAIAQTSSTTQPSSPNQKSTQNTPQNPQAVQQQVRKNLEQAGFTDIRMMPSSFLVRAKDKDGNPVMMVINPDSITAVTAVPERGGQTTGQGNQINSSHTGAGAMGTAPGPGTSK
jgi:hypothetical protein